MTPAHTSCALLTPHGHCLLTVRLTSKLYRSCRQDARSLCDVRLKELEDNKQGQVFACLYREWRQSSSSSADPSQQVCTLSLYSYPRYHAKGS